MTNKHALREAAEKHGDDDILALLDELEAAEKRIVELQKQKNDLLRELAPHIHKVSGPYGTEESIGRYAKDGSIKQSGSCYIQSHSED